MKKEWLQFIVYALSLLISLALDIWKPDVKAVLCTQIGSGGIGNGTNDPTTGHHPTPTIDQPHL